ncbi:MAG: hypothetical protein HQL93_13255 [Magnetococcales bacterium]|nr:hypothetical protein [Magnetococcales bacterium]
MWIDPIVEEVRKNREEYAARFNFDLRAMGKALQEREKVSGRKMISLAHASWIEHAENNEESTCTEDQSDFHNQKVN